MELRCKVCGKPASLDQHFYKEQMLCNRHYLQLRNHGCFLDNKMIVNPERNPWSEAEIDSLIEQYKNGISISDIAKALNRSTDSISRKCTRMSLAKKYPRKNDTNNFKAIYQDYDWFFEKYIVQGKSLQEIAEISGATLRVIQKWADEKHHLNESTYKELKKLTTLQREIVTIGKLGDGHIDRREFQPMYIESHAEDEKDYLFWKYEILKDLCKKEPVYYPESYNSFPSGKQYLCKPYYRLNTRIVNELSEIRSMSKVDIISNMSELQLSCLLLDDGSNYQYWELCVAEWSDEEISAFENVCLNKFKIRFNRRGDERYIGFDAISSKRINDIILRNIPSNLDIIKKKITNNNTINEKKYRGDFYILTQSGKVGLASYCKKHKYIYNKIKPHIDNLVLDFPEMDEPDFINYYMEVANVE